MADIQIVFPEGGATPCVTLLDRAVLEDEHITWDITSYNTNVKSVVIEFVDEQDLFFQTSDGPSHRYEKDFKYQADKPSAKREIYGTAPPLQDQGKGICKSHKYNVVGELKGGGLLKLDPDIVIARP